MSNRYGIDIVAPSAPAAAQDVIVYEDGTEAPAMAEPQAQIGASATLTLADRWHAAPPWVHAAAFVALGYALAKW